MNCGNTSRTYIRIDIMKDRRYPTISTVPETAMHFEWDDEKNRQNLLKHDVRFETAALVFDDPHSLTQRDEYAGEEERWITLGSVSLGTVLFVVPYIF